MTRDQLLERLKRECADESMRAVSRRLGVSVQYISQVVRGERPLSDGLAEKMGYRRPLRYEPVERDRA